MVLRTALFLLYLINVDVASASMPVLICENVRGDKNECENEKHEATKAVLPWFDGFNKQAKNRKHRGLVDCTRFCHEVDHFTFHAPCDCEKRRYLLENTDAGKSAKSSEAQSKVIGPIQVLDEFILALPSGRCKEVFVEARCIVNFVSSYKYDKDADSMEEFGIPAGFHILGKPSGHDSDKDSTTTPEDGDSAGDSAQDEGSVDDSSESGISPNETFDQGVDPLENESSENDVRDGDSSSNSGINIIMEETFDPITNKTTDPLVKESSESESSESEVLDGGSSSNSGINIVLEETFDPITNKTTVVQQGTFVSGQHGTSGPPKNKTSEVEDGGFISSKSVSEIFDDEIVGPEVQEGASDSSSAGLNIIEEVSFDPLKNETSEVQDGDGILDTINNDTNETSGLMTVIETETWDPMTDELSGGGL